MLEWSRPGQSMFSICLPRSTNFSSAAGHCAGVVRLAAVLFLCLELMAQRKGRRLSGRNRRAGNSLTVVEVSYPKRAPNNARCLPGTEYVLEKAHDGRVVSAETVVRLCQTEDQAEITVSVEPNRIEVNRNGGTQAGYFKIHAYQLSPWRPVSMDGCSFYGSGEHTLEQWDFLTLRGEAWYRSAEGEEVGICEASATLPRYLIVPSVAADAAELEKGRGRLGSCAMSLDSSGKHGFVTWGKPDPRDPLEVKLLQAGKGVLLAQVVDAGRTTAPARSWVMADHLEVWMGSRLEERARTRSGNSGSRWTKDLCRWATASHAGSLSCGAGRRTCRMDERRPCCVWSCRPSPTNTAMD